MEHGRTQQTLRTQQNMAGHKETQQNMVEHEETQKKNPQQNTQNTAKTLGNTAKLEEYTRSH